jgi:hypothetical protein
VSARSVEAFLARLYTEAPLRASLVADPRATAVAAGLSDDEASAFAAIDRVGLELAAESYARKRAAHRGPRQAWLRRVCGWLHLPSKTSR